MFHLSIKHTTMVKYFKLSTEGKAKIYGKADVNIKLNMQECEK